MFSFLLFGSLMTLSPAAQLPALKMESVTPLNLCHTIRRHIAVIPLVTFARSSDLGRYLLSPDTARSKTRPEAQAVLRPKHFSSLGSIAAAW